MHIEAFQRFFNPQPINAVLMLGIACTGLTFNLIMAKILMDNDDIKNKFEDDHSHGGNDSHMDIEVNLLEDQDDKEMLNMENKINDNKSNKSNISKSNPVLNATIIHILGDIIQSAGVVLAACIIYFLQDYYPMIVKVDPICTFVFGAIVLSTTIPLASEFISVLMEAAPDNVDQDELLKKFKEDEDIVDFHDIHIWSLTKGKVALTAHFISNNPQKTLERATEISKNFGIYHTTIQVEDYTQRRRASFKICTHINDNQIH
jgi:zinc transporter 2